MGESGKYKTFVTSNVWASPSSSFHIYFTVPSPEGILFFPHIVQTWAFEHDLSSPTNIFLSLQMCTFAELSTTTVEESVSKWEPDPACALLSSMLRTVESA